MPKPTEPVRGYLRHGNQLVVLYQNQVSDPVRRYVFEWTDIVSPTPRCIMRTGVENLKPINLLLPLWERMEQTMTIIQVIDVLHDLEFRELRPNFQED